MKTLLIQWMRLTDGQGKTCPRCSSTEQELEKAVLELGSMLRPAGISVSLQKGILTPGQFSGGTIESNRILIGGRTLEEWLGGRTGQSRCCDVCGDAPCRTVELPGKTYETIPAVLITKACLRAASQLFGIEIPDHTGGEGHVIS